MVLDLLLWVTALGLAVWYISCVWFWVMGVMTLTTIFGVSLRANLIGSQPLLSHASGCQTLRTAKRQLIATAFFSWFMLRWDPTVCQSLDTKLESLSSRRKSWLNPNLGRHRVWVFWIIAYVVRTWGHRVWGRLSFWRWHIGEILDLQEG